MNLIFDSHAHYDDEDFDVDREEFLSSLPERGVFAVLNAASKLDNAPLCVRYAQQYPYIYAAVGVHPNYCLELTNEGLVDIRALTTQEKVVAVGEIGLDYHYDYAPHEVQRHWFEAQLDMANELGLPVIVHDREAHEDILRLLEKHRPRGVLHCFSGSVEMAQEVVKLGMYIGMGGSVTFKNARHPIEVAAFVPDGRLLIETDAPYMAPVPFRGKRNDSTLIPHTAAKIAMARGTSTDSVLEMTRRNACELFQIQP